MPDAPCQFRTKKPCIPKTQCPPLDTPSNILLLSLSKVEDYFPPNKAALTSLFYCSHSTLQCLHSERERECVEGKMKPASKVIMGATLVMVVILAIVLGLVLVLLAELYCSLLLRRRRLRHRSSNTATATSQLSQTEYGAASSLSSFYAQGVLQAPRSLLFPVVSSKDKEVETKKQLQGVLDIRTQEPSTSPHHIGLVSAPSPSVSFVPSPQPLKETSVQIATNGGSTYDKVSGGERENFVYISNPIYDNDQLNSASRGDNTPFETPETSPSRLESGDSSEEDEIEIVQSLPLTPPLTPMKKLPAVACSVSLNDARSLDTSGSEDSHDNGLSSSPSGSPCTSPSW